MNIKKIINIGMLKLINLLKKKHIFFDIESVLPKKYVDARL